MWFVYVIQSELIKLSKAGKPLNGQTYVGCTTDVLRRVKQHSGELSGGAKATSNKGKWILRAVFGPYENRSEAMKAEYALKHSKRGPARFHWSVSDSKWCRGSGADDPLVIAFSINNEPSNSSVDLDKL